MGTEDEDEETVDPTLDLRGGAEAWDAYRGQCVAIVDGEVKASGPTWTECLEAVKRLNLVAPLLAYVPRGAFSG